MVEQDQLQMIAELILLGKPLFDSKASLALKANFNCLPQETHSGTSLHMKFLSNQFR